VPPTNTDVPAVLHCNPRAVLVVVEPGNRAAGFLCKNLTAVQEVFRRRPIDRFPCPDPVCVVEERQRVCPVCGGLWTGRQTPPGPPLIHSET